MHINIYYLYKPRLYTNPIIQNEFTYLHAMLELQPSGGRTITRFAEGCSRFCIIYLLMRD